MLLTVKVLSFFVLLTFITINAAPSPTTKPIINQNITYDQRQSGKYNIHLSIKDVSIISLDGDSDLDATNSNDFYGEYDYDLSDLTISPISAGLNKPVKPITSSSTTATSTTTTTTIITTQKPSTTKKPNVVIMNNNYNKPTITSALPSSTVTTSKPSTMIPLVTNKTENIEQTTKKIINNQYSANENKPYYQQNLQHQIPVQIIMEPILKSKTTALRQPRPQPTIEVIKKSNDNVSIDNFDIHNQQQLERQINGKLRSTQHLRKCNDGEFRDRQGQCSRKRRRSTTSGLKYILNLLSFLKPPKSNDVIE